MARKFDAKNEIVGLDRSLAAEILPAIADPGVPVDGVSIGVADMAENAPHNGEMHPDGDEVLYLISGKARAILESDPPREIELGPGDGLVVPKGIWHRIEVLEPIRIVYVTPGPNNKFRPLTEG